MLPNEAHPKHFMKPAGIKTNRTLCGWLNSFLLVTAFLLVTSAWASDRETSASRETPSETVPYKLTAGVYKISGASEAYDINLRKSSPAGNLWLGYYEAHVQDEHQLRGGWDNSFEMQAFRLIPSLQFASGGFAAFSIQAETGQPWFVGAGFGRTNLRLYWNLNFDPNDSYLLSAGHRTDNGEVIALQLVRDNRQNPDQRHIHLFYRIPRPDGERLTIDLLYKSGLVDGVQIDKWGASLTYDWPRFFLRGAYDPKVNFTPDDMWRIAIGTRF